MRRTNNAIIFAAMVVAGLFAAVFVFVASTGPSQDAQAVVQAPPAVAAEEDANTSMKPMTAESYVQETGKSAVKAEFPVKEIQLKRGTSGTVNVHIKHLGGVNAESSVTVKVSPPTGYILLPKSVAETTTPEQRLQAAQTGQIIPGGIDLSSLMTFTGLPADRSMSIAANNEQIVQVRISLPADFPAEMVGRGFHIPIIVEAIAGDGSMIVAENNGLDIQVVQ